MKDLIILILCLLIFAGVVCYVITNHSARIEQVQVQESPVTATAVSVLKGYHISGYTWQGYKDDDINSMFDILWTNGWRFNYDDYNKSRQEFINRIIKRYPGLIKDNKLIRDIKIDFSTINKTIGYKGWIEIVVTVTFYQWDEKFERKWKGKTSLGRSARNEIGCAVDPRMIPYGSEMYIPGYGIRIADDTGSKCREYGNMGKILVDIRCVGLTKEEIHRLGKKKMKIRVKVK